MPGKYYLHTPDWWEARITDENLKSNYMKGLFKKNFQHLESADYDSQKTDEERLRDYREAWNRILSGPAQIGGGSTVQDMLEAMNRDLEYPTQELDSRIASEPFRKIDQIIKKHQITLPELEHFLKLKRKQMKTEEAVPKSGKKPKMPKFFEEKRVGRKIGKDLG